MVEEFFNDSGAKYNPRKYYCRIEIIRKEE
jgi:hypothetical protein